MGHGSRLASLRRLGDQNPRPAPPKNGGTRTGHPEMRAARTPRDSRWSKCRCRWGRRNRRKMGKGVIQRCMERNGGIATSVPKQDSIWACARAELRSAEWLFERRLRGVRARSAKSAAEGRQDFPAGAILVYAFRGQESLRLALRAGPRHTKLFHTKPRLIKPGALESMINLPGTRAATGNLRRGRRFVFRWTGGRYLRERFGGDGPASGRRASGSRWRSFLLRFADHL